MADVRTERLRSLEAGVRYSLDDLVATCSDLDDLLPDEEWTPLLGHVMTAKIAMRDAIETLRAMHQNGGSAPT